MKTIKTFILISTLIILSSCASSSKKDPNMILNVDPFLVENISTGIKKIFSSDIEKREMLVYFHPRNDQVHLEFKYENNKYQIFLPKKTRLAIQKATTSYLNDFESKKLDLDSRKSRTAYGVSPATLHWGLFSPNAIAPMKINLGYTFCNSSPYFTIVLPNSPTSNYGMGTRAKESVEVILYFNKAQAKTLALNLDQQLLLEALEREDTPKDIGTGPDQY